jgi:hypothetical protein
MNPVIIGKETGAYWQVKIAAALEREIVQKTE